MSHLTRHQRQLLQSIQGDTCPACGKFKDSGKTVCRRCYFDLPSALRNALYDRIGKGYEEAFENAMSHLQVAEPVLPTVRSGR